MCASGLPVDGKRCGDRWSGWPSWSLTYLCSGEAGPENPHFSPACLWAHATFCYLICNLDILNLSLTLGHRVFLADPHSLLLQQNMRAMDSL